MSTPLTAEQRSYMEVIRASGDNLLRIISDVLDLSKIESQSLALEQVPFHIRRTLQQALALLEVTAREKGLEVRRLVALWQEGREEGSKGGRAILFLFLSLAASPHSGRGRWKLHAWHLADV